MLAIRYLRAKRQESFISVISGFSLVGIALGVATLIIVMSVMNGFRHELLKSILGLNGHVTVQASDGLLLRDFDALTGKLRAVPGVTRAAPVLRSSAQEQPLRPVSLSQVSWELAFWWAGAAVGRASVLRRPDWVQNGGAHLLPESFRAFQIQVRSH